MLALAPILLLAACSSFSYDLTPVPFPVSARPAPPGAGQGTPFSIVAKNTMWVHGLLGESQPDVAALLQQECGDCDGVVDFRVEVATSGHDWVFTHLSLGLIRLKTVTISGRRIGGD